MKAEIMYKCGLFVLLFALSSIGLSIGFSDSAGAASAYDDVYKEVDNLYVSYPDTCDPLDVSDNFVSRFLDSQQISQSLKDSYTNAMNGDGRWAVSNQYTLSPIPDPIPDNPNPANSYTQYLMWWTEDNSLEFDWRNGGAYLTGNNVKGIQVFINERDCENVEVYDASSYITGVAFAGGAGGGSSTIQYMYPFFAYVDEDKLNLPSGYDGVIPRDVPPGQSIDDRPELRPDFKYQVLDKKVSLTDHNKDLPTFKPDEGYTFTQFIVEWTVTRCAATESGDEFEIGLCDDPEYLNSERKPQNQTFEYTVDRYGNYQFEAQYLVEQCYRYPSYPDTPDHCFYVSAGAEYEKYRFTYTMKNLAIDGRTIIGDTSLEDCVHGFCTVPDRQNFMSEYFKDKAPSGLIAIFQAPILFYSNLPNMAATCSPISFPLMGRTIYLECLSHRYQTFSPMIFTMYQTIFSALVAYIVATKIFSRIKNINDPENDRIEVVKL